jgi:transcriptional regulator with XRE-family HTH domain
MLPLELQTIAEVAATLAGRVRDLRLDRGWTQRETAERAGLSHSTYREFERTGQISLERLLKLAVLFDALPAFGQLFAPPPARSLEELAARAGRPRKRGRRRDALG